MTDRRRDALLAIVLAVLLGAAWTWRAWADLQLLRLPDTDDVVRLQQVRDWLAGQPFADVTQHRLGAGVPMHWSRLADLVPAALIATLTPLVGGHAAEVAAVILSPLALFAVALFLVARIARSLAPGLAGTACLVAAIAYPATTLFLPGRIDHHGLQMVLMLGATLALLAPAGAGAGVAIGLTAAASLVVGMETAPLFAALGAVALVDWIAGRDGAGERLGGLGVGALVGLAAGKGLFATTAWDFAGCDGFDATAWRAALALAAAPLVPALLDRHVTGLSARAALVAVTVALAGGVALLASPACLYPYAGVSPAMARLWLVHVGEAQPLFAAPTAEAIGYAGLMLAGIVASAWRWRVTGVRGWAMLLAVQLAALATTIAELRGAYAGALLAAPGLAAAIGVARERGGLRVAAAWLASAGMLYPLAADALPRPTLPPATAHGDCASPALLAALDRLPPGLVIAPIDAGAAILGGTLQHVLAAPYHRNGAANEDAYRFYLGGDRTAAAVTARWHAAYWLRCAAMPGFGRLAALPGWEGRLTLPDGAQIIGRSRLSGTPAPR